MVLVLTLFRMGLFMSGGSKKAPFPKICLTYPTMMKLAVILYLKQIQKSYKHVTHLLSSAGITIFSPEMNHFVISRYTDINCILQMIPNSFNFFLSLKVVLINIVAFMMSAKLATLGLFKMRLCHNFCS